MQEKFISRFVSGSGTKELDKECVPDKKKLVHILNIEQILVPIGA
jgi:hypothetical protein